MQLGKININTAGIFITGTDTDIGKTMVTAALFAILRKAKLDATVMKPIQTGCIQEQEKLIAPDIEFCLSKNNLQIPSAEQQLMCPYRFAQACSPHLAAKLNNINIDLTKIEDAFQNLTKLHQLVLVEGAGGVLVPINEQLFMLDLIKALQLPVIIVARPALGTINHTLLTIQALQNNNINIIGIIFNASKLTAFRLIEKDNFKTIEHFSKVPILAALPYIEDFNLLVENLAKQLL